MSPRSVVAFAFALAASSLHAQNSVPDQNAASRAVRTMRAVRATAAPKLDGKLDDAAWGAAEVSSDFTQSYPNAGAGPTQKSEVRVLYDDDALYVGVRMFDDKPDSIAAQL